MVTPPRWEYLYVRGPNGYATAAHRTMAALRASGIDIVPVPFRDGRGWGYHLEPEDRRWARRRPAEVVVAHLMPEYFPLVADSRPGSVVVGHTVWETDRLPVTWPAWLDVLDLVVVPCQMNAEVIRAAGVSTPVHVIPHPVAPPATGVPDLGDELGDLPGALTFYVIGEWTPRKGVAESIQAFTRAFTASEPVRMVVKTMPYDKTRPVRPRHAYDEGTTAFALGRILAEAPHPAPPVSLVTRPLSDDEVAALHALGDCYVSLCRGEGWGIGAFDAATVGTPVITTGWGGHLDYLGESAPYLVRFGLVDADYGTAWAIDGQGQQWAEPDVDHAVEQLRAVAADPDAHRDERDAIARDITSRCSPEAVADLWHAAVPDAG